MVYFMSVLPVATRAIRVWPVFQNLDTAAFAACFFPALFLKGQREDGLVKHCLEELFHQLPLTSYDKEWTEVVSLND